MDATHFLIAGVAVQLLFSFAHALFKSPKQQAQIDAIEAKVDGVLNSLNAPKGGTN